MSVFDPKPSYRVASRTENLAMAMDIPFSPGRLLGESFQAGLRDSFGLGTVIKDFSTPRGVGGGMPNPVEQGLKASPFTAPFVDAYETLRGTFGAQTTGSPMTEDEFKKSAYYRDTIKWDAAMTTDRAAAIAAEVDLRNARAYFGEKNPILSIVGGFAGGGIDPVNFVPVFGPLARTAAAAKFGFVAGHAFIGASEAAINTAVFGALSAPARASLGDDVGFQASINNLAFATVAGLLFGGGEGVIRSIRAGGLNRFQAQAEAKIRAGAETIQNLRDTRAVLNDGVTSLATTGEVRLTPASGTILERINSETIDRRASARALEVETRDVTGTRAGEVVISPSGARVAVRPEVVDISTLQRATGALQVRDRSQQNAMSQAQIEDIAINLDPVRLMPNVDGSQGAPIVGADNVVDSGNGRVMAIARAYDAYPAKAAAYAKALRDAGYSTDGIERPVLVQRRVTDLSPDARAQFNAELNAPTTARMGAVEIAAMDRAALQGALDVLADGPVTGAANRAFVGKFLRNLSQNERGALQDRDGRLTADGVRRIENAILASAYGDVDAGVVRRFAEATDDNTRSVVGALSDVAPAWLRMREAMRRGEVDSAYDATPELTEALRYLGQWREQAAREGRPVSTVIKEGMAQGDLLGGGMSAMSKVFIRVFYTTDRFGTAVGRDTLAARLNDYVNAAMELGQPDMLGEAYAATKLGVLKRVYGDLETALLEDAGDGTGVDPIREAGAGYSADATGGLDQEGTGQGRGDGRSIADRMTERFAAAGRPTDEAKAAGALVDAFYRTQAARLGITPDELEVRFGLPEVRQGVGAASLPEGMLAQGEVEHVESFRRYMRNGFDGLHLPSVREENGTTGDQWLAFDPTQIKSVDNRGTFDPNDPRILFQPAYHGTPHIFDKFDSSKIGTGEGAQAFGYGLYFAGRKSVAEHYREVLSDQGPIVKVGGREVRPSDPDNLRRAAVLVEEHGSVEQAKIALQVKLAEDMSDLRRLESENTLDWLERFGDNVTVEEGNRGSLYTVDIPGDDELLVWDAPLSEQPPKVKAAIEPFLPQLPWNKGRVAATPSGLMLYVNKSSDGTWRAEAPGLLDNPMIAQGLPSQEAAQAAAQKWSTDRMTGAEFYAALSSQMGRDLDVNNASGWASTGNVGDGRVRNSDPAAASAALREAGIPGHRFLDNQSRAKGDGSYNYVIYDDSRINVTGFEQGARGAIEFGDNGRSIISLFETADASTALHETGHHFLHLLKSMADREDAPDAIRGDWEVIKAWWSDNAEAVAADSPSAVTADDVRAVLTTGTTGDRVKDLAVNVGLQEQWARGFEAYLREGTAPTSGLAGVFEQFKRWLSQVYRSVTDLNVKINDDVRGVFDRLLGGETREPGLFGEDRPPVRAVDLTEPAPYQPPEGLAAAAARVGKPEEIKALAEQFGVDENGGFIEQADIDQLREEGRLLPEDEAELAAADQAGKDAAAWAETLRVVAACVVGVS